MYNHGIHPWYVASPIRNPNFLRSIPKSSTQPFWQPLIILLTLLSMYWFLCLCSIFLLGLVHVIVDLMTEFIFLFFLLSVFLLFLCQCFINRTSKLIRLPRYSRKTMVAFKRYEDLYWFRPEPYVQSQR
jgi:hypothetical protein